jgi:hypothetical protein
MPGFGAERNFAVKEARGSVELRHGSGGKKLHTVTLRIPQNEGDPYGAEHRFAPPNDKPKHAERHNFATRAELLQHIAQHVGLEEADVEHRGEAGEDE